MRMSYQRIYNRWGQLVYESFRPDESWDGFTVCQWQKGYTLGWSEQCPQPKEIIVRQAVHVMR